MPSIVIPDRSQDNRVKVRRFFNYCATLPAYNFVRYSLVVFVQSDFGIFRYQQTGQISASRKEFKRLISYSKKMLSTDIQTSME